MHVLTVHFHVLKGFPAFKDALYCVVALKTWTQADQGVDQGCGLNRLLYHKKVFKTGQSSFSCCRYQK